MEKVANPAVVSQLLASAVLPSAGMANNPPLDELLPEPAYLGPDFLEGLAVGNRDRISMEDVAQAVKDLPLTMSFGKTPVISYKGRF